MLSFQHLDVTLPVDKFNGYRGLHTAKTVLPPPSYSSPVAEVFEEIALWLLAETGSLMPLALDLHGQSRAGLASWVPDFSAKPPIEQNYWRSRLSFFATYALPPVLGRAFERRLPGQLCLYGIEVDRISSIAAHAFSSTKAAKDHMTHLEEWFTFATGRCCRSSESHGRQFDDDVFCATMLAGCVKDLPPASSARLASAEDYVQWQHDVQTMQHSTAAGSFHSLLMESHMAAVLGRALFKTKRGTFGIGPLSIRPGDCLWIFEGGNAPFITRQESTSLSGEKQYTLVGHCYHHTSMSSAHISSNFDGQRCACLLI